MTDGEGTEYLDTLARLYCVNAGHVDECIARAAAEQTERVADVSPAGHDDTRSRLAARLVDPLPGELTDAFLSVTGGEANGSAVQLARQHTGAHTVPTRWRSSHGGTDGAGGPAGNPQTRGLVERHAPTAGSGTFPPPLPDAFGGATGEDLVALGGAVASVF